MKSTLIYGLCNNGRRFVWQKKGRLVFVSDHWKFRGGKRGRRSETEAVRQTGVKEGRWEQTRKDWAKGGGQDCRGEREQLAIPKAIKVWFTHSLNKSTYRPSLPFFQVCGSCRSMPTPTLPLGFSFPVTLTWQNSEFQQGFAHMEDSCASCQSLHILHLLCVCLYGKRERERERGLPLMDCFVFCIKPQLWEQF